MHSPIALEAHPARTDRTPPDGAQPPKPKHGPPDTSLPQLVCKSSVRVFKGGIVLMVGQENKSTLASIRFDHVLDPVDNTWFQPAVAANTGNAFHQRNVRQDGHTAELYPVSRAMICQSSFLETEKACRLTRPSSIRSHHPQRGKEDIEIAASIANISWFAVQCELPAIPSANALIVVVLGISDSEAVLVHRTRIAHRYTSPRWMVKCAGTPACARPPIAPPSSPCPSLQPGRFSRFRFLRFLARPFQAHRRRHADRTKPYPVQCRGKAALTLENLRQVSLRPTPKGPRRNIEAGAKFGGAAASAARRKFANAAER